MKVTAVLVWFLNNFYIMPRRKLKGINKNDRNYLTKKLCVWLAFTRWCVVLGWKAAGLAWNRSSEQPSVCSSTHLPIVMVLEGPRWFDYKINGLGVQHNPESSPTELQYTQVNELARKTGKIRITLVYLVVKVCIHSDTKINRKR